MRRTLRLGTRGSLLAMAQSRLVATALSHLHPDLAVSLVSVVTRGDRDQATPLSAVDDPAFFSADLDDALLSGRVDACVHSLKDLPAQPAHGIVRAALPPRADPRDIVLFRRDVRERMRDGWELRIGTSSLRRAANMRDFLGIALPAGDASARIGCTALRGPVEARLRRVHLPPEDVGALDGVVLALAGLVRLWDEPGARAVIAPLLAGMPRMVLPLSTCPAAAGQGVLAVECRADDAATLGIVRALHDPATAAAVEFEERQLQALPAALRAATGATAIMHAVLGPLCYVRGPPHDGADAVQRLAWDAPPAPSRAVPFDGIAWQRLCERRHLRVPLDVAADAAVFAAYWHALPDAALQPDVHLWVSGVESWRQLAARGYWVEGCGDNLGFEDVAPTLANPVLALPPLRDWTALTSGWAADGWHDSGVGRVIATYEIVPPAAGPALDAVRAQARAATHFYWSSREQYRALADVVPAGAHHACGAGKTLQALRAAGIDALPFPSGREWHRWLH
jgi:hydroxymethylbilane synthase